MSEWVSVDPGDWYLDGRIAKLVRPVEGLPERFTVGEPEAGWHQQSGGDLTWQRYILTAPVTLTEDITEIARRAKPHPYSAVAPEYLGQADETLIDFRFGDHRTWIDGADPLTLTLKMESRAYDNKKLRGDAL